MMSLINKSPIYDVDKKSEKSSYWSWYIYTDFFSIKYRRPNLQNDKCYTFDIFKIVNKTNYICKIEEIYMSNLRYLNFSSLS